jgi:hypothetical protein
MISNANLITARSAIQRSTTKKLKARNRDGESDTSVDMRRTTIREIQAQMKLEKILKEKDLKNMTDGEKSKLYEEHPGLKELSEKINNGNGDSNLSAAENNEAVKLAQNCKDEEVTEPNKWIEFAKGIYFGYNSGILEDITQYYSDKITKEFTPIDQCKELLQQNFDRNKEQATKEAVNDMAKKQQLFESLARNNESQIKASENNPKNQCNILQNEANKFNAKVEEELKIANDVYQLYLQSKAIIKCKNKNVFEEYVKNEKNKIGANKKAHDLVLEEIADFYDDDNQVYCNNKVKEYETIINRLKDSKIGSLNCGNLPNSLNGENIVCLKLGIMTKVKIGIKTLFDKSIMNCSILVITDIIKRQTLYSLIEHVNEFAISILKLIFGSAILFIKLAYLLIKLMIAFSDFLVYEKKRHYNAGIMTGIIIKAAINYFSAGIIGRKRAKFFKKKLK